MSQNVWILSVDLKTNTAAFKSGMNEAASTAKSAFRDIGSAAKDGGDSVTRSTLNTRAALGLLDNTIRGDHAAAMADLIHEFQDTSVVMAAIPYAAAIGGIAAIAGIAVEVAEKIKEWREAQEKLTAEQTRFGTAVNESFQGLDDRIIQAEQRSDELRNDHLGALSKQLELINRASMQDLVKEFETVSKAADGVFKILEGHWYTFGIGSAGASHALDQFKTKYDSLLAQGKDAEASDLLKGTRDSAQKVLEAQQAMLNSRQGGGIFGPNVDYTSQYKALAVLQAAGVGETQKEVQAQKTLLDALNAQITAQGKIAEIKNLDSDNAKKQTGNDQSSQASAAARAAAQNQLAIAQQQLAAEKAMADARLTIQQASVQQRLDSDLGFAAQERTIKETANSAEIAALDKSGKDYSNQLKSLRDQQLLIEATYEASVASLRSKANVDQYQQDIATFQQSEREKINATQQGSAERLAAIDAAMKASEAKSLQETDFYRQLGNMRVQAERDAAQQETQAKLQGIADQARVDQQAAEGDLRLAQQRLAARGSNIADMTALEVAGENTLYDIQKSALEKELQTLRESGNAKTQEIERINQQVQTLTQEHEQRVNQIQAEGSQRQAQEFSNAMGSMEASAAKSTLKILTGQQSFNSVMSGLANQLAQNLISAELEKGNEQRQVQLGNAKVAASNVYATVSGWPVVGPVLAPVLAGSAFATVMAFNTGTDMVPGIGNRDTVPAMLTPGEGIVPGGVMDGLRKVASNGGFQGGGSTTHIHLKYSPQVHAIDGPSVQKMLKTHGTEFTKHFHSTVRRMNKG